MLLFHNCVWFRQEPSEPALREACWKAEVWLRGSSSHWSSASASLGSGSFQMKLSQFPLVLKEVMLPELFQVWAQNLPTHTFHLKECLVTKSSLTLCDPMDCSPPGSSIHRIFQARILEWVAISFSRGSSWARDWTHVCCGSCIGRWILYLLSHPGSLLARVNINL